MLITLDNLRQTLQAVKNKLDGITSRVSTVESSVNTMSSNMVNSVNGQTGAVTGIATTSEVDALETRVDNIITPSGDPSLTEITDARVGADSTVYSTLKGRIDGEVSELNERLDDEGLSSTAKEALLACFQHIAFLDNDEDYYGNLRDALYGEEPEPTEGTVEINQYVIGNFSSSNDQITYDGIAKNRVFPNPMIYETRPGNVTYTASITNNAYMVTIGRIKSTAENDSLVTQGVNKVILSSFTVRDGKSLPWTAESGSLNVEGYDYIMPVIKRADNADMTSADLQAIQNSYTLTWRVQEDG